jgi:arylsulfatase A-like enzyme
MFTGYMQEYHATFDLEGRDVPGGYQTLRDPHYRVDIRTRAALAFLDRCKQDDSPFFLLLGYFAPHSPIEGPPQYMARLQHVQPEIRRKALASFLAMDDGIGMLRQKLQDLGLTESTLIF